MQSNEKSDFLPPEPEDSGSRKWTRAQRAAMYIQGRTILVSAAAGSGKTATLTERIIRMIKGSSVREPMDITRMLIVTFTRAAAAELKSRISTALSDAIAKDPGNRHLYRELLLLGSADIGTIDSFFEKPVRANFEQLGLSPSLRHADDAEMFPICEAVMNGIIDSMYVDCTSAIKSGRKDNAFLYLIDSILPLRDSSSLVPILLKLYGKLITCPGGVDMLREYSDRMSAEADMDLFETLPGKIMRNDIADQIYHVGMLFDEACRVLSEDSILKEKYLPFFEEDGCACRMLSEKIRTATYTEAAKIISSYAPRRIILLKSDEKSELSEKYKYLRTSRYNKSIKSISQKYFSLNSEEIGKQFRYTSDTCRALYMILSGYDRQIAEEKRMRGIYEFSDMPRYMLKLLMNADGTPTEVALAYRREYDAVFVDEYQDVNEIQDMIFKLIGDNHRFLVGDIKQSIYRFREAEPSIFADYRANFPPVNMEKEPDDESHPDGCSVFMSENFRCDENIISFVNKVCSYLFSSCEKSIGYTEDDDLVFAKKLPSPEYKSPRVVLNLIEHIPSDKTLPPSDDILPPCEAEAAVTADEINNLLSDGKLADSSFVRPSDIVVLVRSSDNAKLILSALSERGIPAVFPAKNDILTSDKMKTLINLLDVIDNPHSDIPLSELLTSPYFLKNLSLEEIIHVRQMSDDAHSLYDAISNYASAGDELSLKCADIIAWIIAARKNSIKYSADKLLLELSSDDTVRSLTDSPEFTAMYDSSCNYVRNSWNGLYGFIRYFKRYAEKGNESTKECTGGDGAVTIMTIHHSKGLEFPVCFLFGAGSGFNLKDASKPILFSKRIGAAVKQFDIKTCSLNKTVIRNVIASELNDASIEEEMRVLYVAMTRAREKLYISAVLDKPFDTMKFDAALAKKGDRLPTLAARNYITWIINALYGSNHDSDSYDIRLFGEYTNDKTLIRKYIPRFSEKDPATQNIPESDTEEYVKIIGNAHSLTAESALLASLPAKAAASLVKPGMLDSYFYMQSGSTDGIPDIKNPDVMSGTDADDIKKKIQLISSDNMTFEYILSQNIRPTASERGSAAHLVLQYCDYDNVLKNGIDTELKRLLDGGFISQRTADIVMKKQIGAFFRSNFFGLIKSAVNIQRELKFGLFVPIKELLCPGSNKAELVGDRTLYVQGSIDLLAELPDGSIILCDYKTDAITDEERADTELLRNDMTGRHGDQLRQYVKAVTAMFGKPPAGVYIYSLPLGEAVKINLSERKASL